MGIHEERDTFLKDVKCLYATDPLFTKVISHPKKHPAFSFENALIFSKNRGRETILCIPRGKSLNGNSLYGIIAEQAHKVLGHFRGQQTLDYVQCWYWWPHVNGHIEEFCKTCNTCQQAKTSNKKPAGELHQLPIPTQP